MNAKNEIKLFLNGSLALKTESFKDVVNYITSSGYKAEAYEIEETHIVGRYRFYSKAGA